MPNALTSGGSKLELLDQVEATRNAGRESFGNSRADLGQFLTPAPVGQLMASMFSSSRKSIHLLDPGAGIGSLTAAFVAEVCQRRIRPAILNVTAWEIDRSLVSGLQQTLDACATECSRNGVQFEASVNLGDYLLDTPTSPSVSEFDCVIMNPPYRKLRSSSRTHAHLKLHGIDTTNLYAAFIAVAARQIRTGGELVSITPRSFCNGPYFRNFRTDLFSQLALRRIHLFDSRSTLFKDDNVLQENVVMHARRGRPAKNIQISTTTSTGTSSRRVASEQILHPGDPEKFIHIPAEEQSEETLRDMECMTAKLHDLGLQVSTGRVVAFRAREHLRQLPANHCSPLLYPSHFRTGRIEWPQPAGRKPNAIHITGETSKLLVPPDVYVLVKRFTSKEERKRIVAALCLPEDLPDSSWGFENHLNYFHMNGRGIPRPLASGLVNYLNSSLADRYFRMFNGHTQVNATDLRNLSYPTRVQLERLTNKSNRGVFGSQEEIDAALSPLHAAT